MSENTFYVTTPIYYVNDKPHIGHAYTTILADVLARYHRLLGDPTHFLTGTDEHGQKVQSAADKNGITPQEQCDQTVVRFQELWTKLEITHDDFIRTTEERHRRIVRKILQDLYDRGEIYASDYEGWYCVPCERFFTEKDLVDDKCPECNRPVDKLMERNYFFRMGKYQEWLIDYINTNPDFIQPAHRRQETLGFLRKSLNDLCISRPKSRLNWGIELPFDADYVTYVWFDALVNYISAVGYGSNDELFAKWWPASYHLIGKDILTTHTVYWPTMLKAMGVAQPQTVFAHGWWLVGKDKMSKSVGNVVNPITMAETYGVDAFRYFLMAEMTLGQDASFTEDAFVISYNANLANDLGNLASRVLKMAKRNLDSTLPTAPKPGPDEKNLIDATLGAVRQMEISLQAMQLDRGLAEVQNAVRAANKYFENMAPWNLAKNGDTDALERVIYSAAECLRIVSGLLYPVMPDKMTALRIALGLNPGEISPHMSELAQWGSLPTGRHIGDLSSLFPRIDVKKTCKPTEKAEGKKNKKVAKQEPVGLIDIQTFSQVKMKSARVTAAEVIKDSKKLLKLQIDLGSEQRQIVAGVAQHYSPDELVGKTIVVVTNLEPATLFDTKSNGMLLAAKAGKSLRLITVDGDVPPGSGIG